MATEYQGVLKQPLLFASGLKLVLVGFMKGVLFHTNLFCLIGAKVVSADPLVSHSSPHFQLHAFKQARPYRRAFALPGLARKRNGSLFPLVWEADGCYAAIHMPYPRNIGVLAGGLACAWTPSVSLIPLEGART